jgi:hypothetical protein
MRLGRLDDLVCLYANMEYSCCLGISSPYLDLESIKVRADRTS